MYYQYRKKIVDSMTIKTKEQITPMMYLKLYENKDEDRITIKKERKCFLWEDK